jgi:hypothetical protein
VLFAVKSSRLTKSWCVHVPNIITFHASGNCYIKQVWSPAGPCTTGSTVSLKKAKKILNSIGDASPIGIYKALKVLRELKTARKREAGRQQLALIHFRFLSFRGKLYFCMQNAYMYYGYIHIWINQKRRIQVWKKR